jgi:GntR family transcriptional regulator, transcriptional repressor for pyruvate dehydrogenase complex
MNMEPIRKETLAKQAQDQILQSIRTAGIRPGDPLPGELELAGRFQVSRSVIREAMGQLRLIGLIDTRKSRGAILAQPDLFAALRLALDPAFVLPQTSRELFELRLVLEMGMVDLLHLRRDRIDHDELQVIATRCESAANENERVQADIDFHAALYRATGNRTLTAFQQLLRSFFQQVIILERQSTRRSGRIQHIKLADIVKNGSCDELRSAMREHLSVHFQRLDR